MQDTVSEARERAHSAVRESPRRVAIVGVVLLLMTAGVAAQTVSVVDDFESGTLSNQWEGRTTASDVDHFSVDMGATPDGDYYLNWDQSTATAEIWRPMDSTQPDSVKMLINMGSSSQDEYTQIRTYNSSGDYRILVRIDNTQSPAVLEVWRGGFTATNVTIPLNEWHEIEFTGLYDSTPGYNVTVNNQTTTSEFYASGNMTHVGFSATDNSPFKADYIRTAQETEGGGTTADSDKRLELDTRSLFKPNSTHPYQINFEDVGNVTGQATLTSSNSTLLAVDSTNYTLSSINDSNVSAVVTLNASYVHNNTTYYAEKDVVVAEATVENLAILPGGTWRTSAVLGDGFFQALLVAMFIGVAMTRFTSAFGGLAGAQMVLTIGWFAGYVSWAMAAVSLFVALFIGLNLAANIDYTVRR